MPIKFYQPYETSSDWSVLLVGFQPDVVISDPVFVQDVIGTAQLLLKADNYRTVETSLGDQHGRNCSDWTDDNLSKWKS